VPAVGERPVRAGKAPAVLGVDTSGPFVSVAIADGAGREWHRHVTMERGQAEHLIQTAEALLHDAGMDWRDLAALAVAVGPGNFTGVRIGVAAVRGLALGLGIPAHGVSAFDVLRHGAPPGPSLASVAAPRGQVYLHLHVPGGPTHAATQVAPDELTSPPCPVGTICLGEMSDDLAARFGLLARASTPAPCPALAVARVALGRLGQPAPRPAPFYVRPADAAPPSDPPPVILDA
jgi:tRNA threonylcarbamoyl adenosine modification protein YeaZ